MKIASVQFPVFEPYKKPTFEIYISGCTRNCVGCHNPELANFEAGDYVHTMQYLRAMPDRSTLFDVIAITGGDLLCQDPLEAETFVTLMRVTFPDKEMWLFTGADSLHDVPAWAKENFDYIKTGPYKQELKQTGFPASSNQKLHKKGTDY